MNIRTYIVGILVTLLPILHLEALEPFSLQTHCLATIIRNQYAVLDSITPRPRSIFNLPVPNELQQKIKSTTNIKNIVNQGDPTDTYNAIRKALNHTPMICDALYLSFNNNMFKRQRSIALINHAIHYAQDAQNAIRVIDFVLNHHDPAFINETIFPESVWTTALDCSIQEKRSQLAVHLLGKGANPNNNASGKTPLQLAAVLKADKETVTALLKHGGDLTIEEPDGTALQIAQNMKNHIFLDAVNEWQNSQTATQSNSLSKHQT